MVLQKFCGNLTYSSKGHSHYTKWIDILEIFTDHEQKEKSRLAYSLYLDRRCNYDHAMENSFIANDLQLVDSEFVFVRYMYERCIGKSRISIHQLVAKN